MYRLLLLIATLTGRRTRMRRDALADQLEVSERTIRRDIESINELSSDAPPDLPFRFPRVETGRDEEGFAVVWLERADLSTVEMYRYAAVHTAVSQLASLDPEILGPQGLSGLSHIVPGGASPDFIRRIEQAFYHCPYIPKHYSGEVADILEDVLLAILYRHPVTMQYQGLKAPEPKEHRFEPRTLVMYRDAFYVLGCFDAHPDDVTCIAIDRILDITLHRDDNFSVPDDFSPDDYFDGVFGVWRSSNPAVDITVAFDAEIARFAEERIVPGTVGWSDLPDGRRALHLNLPLTPDLVSWVLSWRQHAEVLEPPAFRQRVAEAVGVLASRYRT